LAVLVTGFVLVALAVVRREEFFGNAASGAQGGIEGLTIVLGETLAPGQAFGIEDFVQLESQIAGTEQRLGHGGLPFLEWAESRRGEGGVNRKIDSGDGQVKDRSLRQLLQGI